MGEQAFWVYILEKSNGKFYIGSTDDVERTVAEHNDPVPGRMTYAHKNGPWRLEWKEAHATRSSAMLTERHIKAMKSSKWIREHLLNGRVPRHRD